jgi:hypothetical protein
MNAPPRSIRSENRHPQAYAAFFLIATACSYGFLRERTSSSRA